MSRGVGIAAVVLAAGMSARMGQAKPLLPLGSKTAIERLICSLASSEVSDTVVVTGHDPDGLGAVLEGLNVRSVHNERYESGMFSSVRTGVAALRDDVEAFFIMLADHPLIRTEVLDRLIEAFRRGKGSIVHPSCCRLRGHPPLVAGRFRDAVSSAETVSSLRDFLRQQAEDEVEIETEDATVLMDMDTRDDYLRLGRFAELLDAAADKFTKVHNPGAAHANDPGTTHADDPRTAQSGSPATAGTPGAGRADGLRAADEGGRETPESTAQSKTLATGDALYLLSLLEVPADIVRHSQTVALVGETLARALLPYAPDLDVDLVRTAGLLHDMAKAVPRHAVVAQNILRNLGLSRLGAVVGAHMVLPAEQRATFLPTEEQLVYLADKLVIEDEIAGVDARAARALSRHGGDAVATEGIHRRMRTAALIRQRVETLIQRPLEEVLPRNTSSST